MIYPTCNTCKHWKNWQNYDGSLNREDFEPSEGRYEVRDCQHPEFQLKEDAFPKEYSDKANILISSSADSYALTLGTTENFGCIRHSSLEND